MSQTIPAMYTREIDPNYASSAAHQLHPTQKIIPVQPRPPRTTASTHDNSPFSCPGVVRCSPKRRTPSPYGLQPRAQQNIRPFLTRLSAHTQGVPFQSIYTRLPSNLWCHRGIFKKKVKWLNLYVYNIMSRILHYSFIKPTSINALVTV